MREKEKETTRGEAAKRKKREDKRRKEQKRKGCVLYMDSIMCIVYIYIHELNRTLTRLEPDLNQS